MLHGGRCDDIITKRSVLDVRFDSALRDSYKVSSHAMQISLEIVTQSLTNAGVRVETPLKQCLVLSHHRSRQRPSDFLNGKSWQCNSIRSSLLLYRRAMLSLDYKAAVSLSLDNLHPYSCVRRRRAGLV
ncbi:hypothetical protein MRB53_038004 [Persea americana]|nr:hypothetical protein MRB53_038004 [Persea americana]